MEIIRLGCLILCSFLVTSCSFSTIEVREIKNVFVSDFHSDEIKACRPSDVELSHRDAYDFFHRAKIISLKTMHDHYNYAPCYIEGTLLYHSTLCEWEIRAGATGRISCGKKEWYFACDNCEDLF
jgi:hypothetical protein